MNKYELTYIITRRTVLENKYFDFNAETVARQLRALDTAYMERKPFPLELLILYGDPLLPPAETWQGF